MPTTAQRGLNTGSAPSTARDDSVGRGLQQIGNSVGQAAEAQARLEERAITMAQQQARFAAQQNLRAADARIDAKMQELSAGMDPSAPDFGIGAGFIGQIDKVVADEYDVALKDLPAALRPELEPEIAASATVWQQQAIKVTTGGLQKWYGESVDLAIDQAKTTVYGNPDHIDAALADIDKLIDSSGLHAGPAAAKKREARIGLQAAAAGRELLDDPSALQSKLGIAPPSSAAALIRAEEGYRSTAYADTRTSTGKFDAYRVGYGSDTITLADGTVEKVRYGSTITAADAERDLERRLGEFETTAKGQVGEAAWNKLPESARAGLLSTTYNYGRLPSSVVKAINSGDTEAIAAAVEALDANPERRAREAAVIRGGAIPSTEYSDLPFDTRRELYDRASAQNRAQIDIAVTNAPAAISSTGSYSGVSPLPGDFMSAYGPQEGAQRYSEYAASLEVARAAHQMRTLPPAEIAAAVKAAEPVATGNTAALEAKRYDALSTAATETMKARNADPGGYTAAVFPEVAAAWEAATVQGASPEAYSTALNTAWTAQQQLGIAKPSLLPKAMADDAVTAWRSVDKPEADRVGGVMQLMGGATPEQQRAIFDQLVDAGLPESAAGAVDAMVRGDRAAGQRLFRAALIDPTSLPGKLPESTDRINEAIQSGLMAPGSTGDLYYGLTDGDALNLERAVQDQKLIGSAVRLRLLDGEPLDQAVTAVGRDLFGDVVPVKGRNVSVLLDPDTDANAAQAGFGALLPKVRDVLNASAVMPPDLAAADSSKAIFESAMANHVEAILNEGFFRNSDQGFVFIDPFAGAAIEGADGQPMVWSIDQVLGAAGSAPKPVDPMAAERAWLEQQASTFAPAGGGR